MRPFLVIFSGPAGIGKTTLTRALAASDKNLGRVITATTRPKRAGEQEGKDYYFLSQAAFEQAVKQDAFLEHAQVYQHCYGTFKEEVERQLTRFKAVLLSVDIQGAKSIRQHEGACEFELLTIFLKPKSLESLRERLLKRASESATEMAKRLQQASLELEEATLYDYIVESQTKELDLEAARRLIAARLS